MNVSMERRVMGLDERIALGDDAHRGSDLVELGIFEQKAAGTAAKKHHTRIRPDPDVVRM